MKIAIADNCALKFCQDLKEHWEKKHEVRYEIGASEILSQWADVYYIEWFDNNLHYLFNWYKEHPNAKKPKFAVRVIDWDYWVRGVRSQEMVDFVDYWICIAEHIKKGLLEEKDDRNGQLINWEGKLNLIKPGVNLDKFTFEAREGYGVAMVTGDIWVMKNVMEGLMIFALLVKKYPNKPWHLHWRGQWADHARYMQTAVEYFLESRGISDKVTLYPDGQDMNEWYNKSAYILTPSIKEAFSYATAEAMAKGLKPIVNNWLGSEYIWPVDCRYNTVDEAVDMFNGNIESLKYRRLIEMYYSNQRMFYETDKLLDIER